MANPRPVGVLDVAPQVMKLLGVDIAGVVSFSLHFDAGDLVRLRVEHVVDKDCLQHVLQEFVIDWRQGAPVSSPPSVASPPGEPPA
jgi:hypothetical protein